MQEINYLDEVKKQTNGALVVTVAHLAAILGKKPGTLYDMISDGILPFDLVYFGRAPMVRATDVAYFLQHGEYPEKPKGIAATEPTETLTDLPVPKEDAPAAPEQKRRGRPPKNGQRMRLRAQQEIGAATNRVQEATYLAQRMKELTGQDVPIPRKAATIRTLRVHVLELERILSRGTATATATAGEASHGQ